MTEQARNSGGTKRFPRISKQSIEDIKETVTLLQLATALGDEMVRRGQQFFLDCPNSEHQETTRFEHFSLRPSKNICKCFTCNIFINNPLSYYAYRKHGRDIFSRDDNGKTVTDVELFKEAIFEVAKLFGKEIKDEEGNVMVKPDINLQTKMNAVQPIQIKSLDPQSDQICDAVYKAFLSLCPLRKEHIEELTQKRKYSIQEIQHLGIRSVPTKDEWVKIYQVLHSKGYPLERVPGFAQIFIPTSFHSAFPLSIGEKGNFKDAKAISHEGHWFYAMNASNGYFIPVRNENGLITRLRVRRDTGEPKYIWFSSDHNVETEKVIGHVRKNGASSGAPLHIAVPPEILFNWKAGDHISDLMLTDTVLITEGEHKANIVSRFFGIVVIGVPGAGAFESILLLLREWGVKKCIIAYDMDTLQRTDESEKSQKKQMNLFNILRNFAVVLKQQDVAAYLWTWNMKDGKGLDDLILNNRLPIEFNLRTSTQRAVSKEMVHEIM